MKKEDLGTICWIEIRKDRIEKIMCVREKNRITITPQRKNTKRAQKKNVHKLNI